MNLEKLGFLMFLKATQEHQKVAAPIKTALTQLLVAGLNSAKLVQTATIESEVLKPYGSAHKTLKQFDALSSELIQWLNQNDSSTDASKKTISRQIVGEILAGLAAEKDVLENSEDPLQASQIQVLTAISEALKNRFLNEGKAAKTPKVASKQDAS